MTVLAAIESSAAAQPVLTASRELARLYGTSAKAVYIHYQDGHTVRDITEPLGIPLDVVTGPTTETMTAIAARPDVVALVIGARNTPGGKRPLGTTARTVAAAVHKPVLIVPPQSHSIETINRILVSLDPDKSNVDALGELLTLFCEQDCDVTALYVREELTLPMFEDQPHHTREAWHREFQQRYCADRRMTLTVSVGVPADVVMGTARSLGAHMVVIGWNEQLGSDLDELPREILSRTAIPTLLVPARLVPASKETPTVVIQ